MSSSICSGCTHYVLDGDRSMCKECRKNITLHGEPLSYESREVKKYKEELAEKLNKLNPYRDFSFNTTAYLAGYFDALDKVRTIVEE